MKRYPKYKDSGVKWIGEIPEHWEVRREKTLFYNLDYLREPISAEKRSRKNPIYDYYGASGVIDTIDYYNVDDTVLLIGEDGANLRMRNLPLIYKASGKFWVNNHAHILKPKDGVDYDYMYYALESTDYNDFITGAAQPKLSQENLSKVKYPLPPQNEQQAIVAYLDEKVGKIDRYISEKEKEIVALDELKQATIANAVTRGLDPNAPLKDSGIKWIGNIPQHWEVKQMRNYLTLVSEKNHPEKQLLSVTREQGVIIRNTESKEENHNYIPDDLSGYKYVKEGQFVINKMKSWQGSYGVSDYEGIVSPAYYVCDLSFPCKEFFSKAVRSKAYIPFFTQYSKGIRVDQWDLSTIGLKTIPFIEPPIEEQQAIVDYINTKTAKIDQMKDGIKSEIEKLKEYKQRLISDVVTGKVCVKGEK